MRCFKMRFRVALFATAAAAATCLIATAMSDVGVACSAMASDEAATVKGGCLVPWNRPCPSSRYCLHVSLPCDGAEYVQSTSSLNDSTSGDTGFDTEFPDGFVSTCGKFYDCVEDPSLGECTEGAFTKNDSWTTHPINTDSWCPKET